MTRRNNRLTTLKKLGLRLGFRFLKLGLVGILESASSTTSIAIVAQG
jgi:hypothetical protein